MGAATASGRVRSAATRGLDAAETKSYQVENHIRAVADEVRRRARAAEEADTLRGTAAQAGRVITVVVIGVVSLIGILIYGQVDSALPSPDNQNLTDAQSSVTEGFAGAMELIPVVLIVLVAAVVIGVVSRLR